MKKLFQIAKKHKIISLVILVAVIGGGYYVYGKYNSGSVQVSYTTAAVTKGTIITSVAGSGQISASDQVEIKAKVSADVTKIYVTNAQAVKSGDLIMQLDTTDAYKAVRDANANLQSAQLSYDKLVQAADVNSVQQAQNTVTSAQVSLDKLKLSQPIDYQNVLDDLQTAQNNLTKAYSDSFTAISNSYLNLPNIITALNDILTSEQISASDSSLGKGQINTSVLYNTTYETDQFKIKSYQTIAESDYTAARQAYDASYSDFKSASVYSDTATIENLLAETLATAKAMAQAIKSENNYLAVWSDSRALRNSSIFTQVATYKTNLSTYSGQTNTSLSNLSNSQSTIQSDKDAVASANDSIRTLTQNQPLDLTAVENSLKEKQTALAKLKAGVDPLDIRSQELSLQQKRNSLYDAQRTLADYTIKAPFDGVIAKVNVKVGDSASAASLATIITKQQIVEISLNEVDIAKVKLNMKASLTFDAIDGLEITGKVVDIDSVGTVSQGVVSYVVKIALDTQDDRIKTGMSVNATVITNVKTDVLTVPNSAVKTNNGGGSYVQTLDASGNPQQVTVQIGISSDTDTEIISGLNEGDKVITQTINASATAQPSGSTGGMGIPGIGGGGGGGGNAIRRAVGD